MNEQAKFFIFAQSHEKEVPEDTFRSTVQVSDKNKDELLNEIAKKFCFPNTFGRNWDALSDSLRDLSWIKEKHVEMYHEGKFSLTRMELKIYLVLLVECMNDWRIGEPHTFSVYFERDQKTIVEELVNC